MNAEKIGLLIYELRTRKGFTQKELAEKCNVSDKAVSKWERGDGCPDVTVFPRLAEVFGIEVETIMNGEIPFSQDVSGKTIKEYESSDCVIYVETLFNINKTQINDFYTKHYVFTESFIDKYLKVILIVSCIIVIFAFIVSVVLVKYIRKKCNGGYTAVRTNKSIELGEFTP